MDLARSAASPALVPRSAASWLLSCSLANSTSLSVVLCTRRTRFHRVYHMESSTRLSTALKYTPNRPLSLYEQLSTCKDAAAACSPWSITSIEVRFLGSTVAVAVSKEPRYAAMTMSGTESLELAPPDVSNAKATWAEGNESKRMRLSDPVNMEGASSASTTSPPAAGLGRPPNASSAALANASPSTAPAAVTTVRVEVTLAAANAFTSPAVRLPTVSAVPSTLMPMGESRYAASWRCSIRTSSGLAAAVSMAASMLDLAAPTSPAGAQSSPRSLVASGTFSLSTLASNTMNSRVV
mmetsp:Transcript_81212/g.162012  ORF Transcript_81212/g.162012 Transcript_81212/m.162012 type:complete len:296 (-) Transcript_81212:338-1225(-)